MSDEGIGRVILYEPEDGVTRIACRFEEDSVWLTQALMAALFQVSVPTVNHHLHAIYAEGELERSATVRSHLIVRTEGNRSVSREVEHYSLPVILAVGYRVRGPRGTQFRQWATARLEEYLRKGFVMDDARLRDPPGPGVPDYFDELLARIETSARASGGCTPACATSSRWRRTTARPARRPRGSFRPCRTSCTTRSPA